jgi:hypothetical protein
MLRLNKILLAPLGLVCLLAVIAQAQPGPVFRADTRLVVLHATVMDRHDRLVTNLPQSAFRVYENGVQQQIKVFRREDVPVSLGLVVDNSGSMRDKRQKTSRSSKTDWPGSTLAAVPPCATPSACRSIT